MSATHFDQPSVDGRDFDGPRECCVTCGEELQAGEASVCNACTPCACGMPCGDPEPPTVDGVSVCELCFDRHHHG